MGVRKEEVTKT